VVQISFVHGKDVAFQLDDSAGTLRNIRVYLNAVNGLPGARALSEVTAFGDQGTRWIPGMANQQFTIAGSFDTTATTGVTTVLNGLRTATATATFEYGPEGSASGKVKYSGECWLTDFTVDSAIGDKVPVSATFQVDGVVTPGTYA
jgi:hypothetical protein